MKKSILAFAAAAVAVSVTGGKFDASVAQYVETGYQYDEQTQTVVLMPAPEEETNGE